MTGLSGRVWLIHPDTLIFSVNKKRGRRLKDFARALVFYGGEVFLLQLLHALLELLQLLIECFFLILNARVQRAEVVVVALEDRLVARFESFSGFQISVKYDFSRKSETPSFDQFCVLVELVRFRLQWFSLAFEVLVERQLARVQKLAASSEGYRALITAFYFFSLLSRSDGVVSSTILSQIFKSSLMLSSRVTVVCKKPMWCFASFMSRIRF